jgi:hypothetical protein
MKKLSLLACLCAVAILAYAAESRTWEFKTLATGTTEIIPAVAGKRALLKNMIVSVSNACSVYFFTGTFVGVGTTPQVYKLTGDVVLSAKGAWVSDLQRDPFYLIGLEGQSMSIWTSAAPGGEITYRYEYVRS